jgi:valyl-tRNA synthetase
MDLPPGKPLPVLLQQAEGRDLELAARHRRLLERVGRVESVRALGPEEAAPMSATALLGNMKLLVPMKGNIDVAAEKSRLARQRRKIDSDLTKSQLKLGNADFVNNAPAAVVSKETERVQEFARQLGQLDEQLAKLDAVG